MSIYDVDYKDKIENQDLPPDKRINYSGARNKMVNWLWSLIATPMQWIRDLIFTSYKTGAVAATYNGGTTYAFGDRIIIANQMWQSLQADNTGNVPGPGSEWWILIQDNIFGTDEQLNYGPQILTLTYALNRWFGTTFKQPPLTSDIYIMGTDPVFTTFTVGDKEPISSDVNDDTSTQYVFDTEIYLGAPTYSFKIMVPAAVYAALGATAEQIMRQVADKYVISGIAYIIQTY